MHEVLKEQIFDFVCCYGQKNQYGWYGEIGVWLYKWLYNLEMVDICWRKFIEKM